MSLVFETYAIKVTNKGGGLKQSVVNSPTGWMLRTEKVSGSDYVTFNCPVATCGHRNKQCVLKAQYQIKDGQLLAFKCTLCRRSIEVKRPLDQSIRHGVPSLIVTPEQFAKEQHKAHGSRASQ